MSAAARVLVADDEPSIRFVLRETLESAGHQVVEVDSGDAALAALAGESFEVAFFDIRMPGLTGLELLDRVGALGGDLAVVIITAQGTFGNAVEAMKRGALDYLVKPFGTAEVLALVEKALRTRSLRSEIRRLRREVGGRVAPGERLVGRSPALIEVFKTIGRVARTDVAVLITGESGTGKELIASAIHNASARAERPLVAVNAAAIPRELLESDLFGHERGAFTHAVRTRMGRFEQADGGTIFLDEISEMSPGLQGKILRVLQDRSFERIGGVKTIRVDIRVIAATNRDLEELVRLNRFREDLYYRLNVIPIRVPPLRERTTDIPLLARHFLQEFSRSQKKPLKRLSPAALDLLGQYPWPGNVRELENLMERLVILTEGELLDVLDLPEKFQRLSLPLPEAAADFPERGLHLTAAVQAFERGLILKALERTNWVKSRAAALLHLNRTTLLEKMKKQGVPATLPFIPPSEKPS